MSGKARLAFGFGILTLLVLSAISYRPLEMRVETGQWPSLAHEERREAGDLHVVTRAIGAIDKRAIEWSDRLLRGARTEKPALLSLDRAYAQGRLDQIKIVLALGTALSLLLILLAFRSIFRQHAARRAAEERLRESEERVRNLANNIPQLAWMADQKGYIFWYNQQWFDQTDTTLARAAGWGWHKAEQPGRVERLFRRSQAESNPLGGGDAIYRSFLSSAVPIRDPQGQILRWFGANTEAKTELKTDAVAAESSEAGGKYRRLLEVVPEALLVVNPDSDIVFLNMQAEKLFGYSAEEILGHKVRNVVPEGIAERLVPSGIRSAAEALARQIGTSLEVRGHRKDGSEFPIEVLLTPLQSADGAVFIAAVRDITGRKTTETVLNQRAEQLARSNEELEKFACVTAHDLQEPLRMVATYTQLLSRRCGGKLDAESQEFLSFAVDGAKRMQRFIRDVLAYSHADAPSAPLTSSEAALQVALANLRSAIEESGALVTHDTLPAVVADRTQLVQLFQNLIGNGIRHQSRPGTPRVHISAAKNGERWTFSVQDNGPGIDPQYFDGISGVSQQREQREDPASAGIGLAICKKIVQRHGGDISVESTPGHGSTFHFALPGGEEKR